MMTKTTAEAVSDLRQRAEEQLQSDVAKHTQPGSPLEMENLLHELRVHQIELEMQNEELRLSQGVLDAERVRYFDLYDLAPVGYLTLNDNGLILQANLTAATLLGVARNFLQHKPLSKFISPDDEGAYSAYKRHIDCGELQELQPWEMRLKRADGSRFWAQLLTSLALNGERRITLTDISDRKMAEKTVRESEELFRSFAENANDVLFTLSREGVFTYLSPNWKDVSGYEPGEMIGKQFAPFVHPDDISTCSAALQSLLTTGRKQQNIEFRHQHKDGSYIWYSVNASLLHDPISGAASLFGIARDITEQRQREAVLEARLRLLHTSASQTLAELLRATLDEAEALTGSQVGFYHFLAPDQVTLSLQVWSTNTAKVMCKVEGVQCHYPLEQAGVWAEAIHLRRAVIHNDYTSLPNRKGLPEGHAPVIRELVVPIMRGGNIVALLGVGNKPTEYDEQDIAMVMTLADQVWEFAEKKRAETELQESNDRHRFILQTAMNGFWLLDLHGRLIEVNDMYCQLSGYSEQELLSMNVADIEADETIADIAARTQQIRERGQARFETRHRRKDGSIFDVEICCQYQPIEGGYLVVFIRDITERKQSESKMHKLSSAIEQSPVSIMITDTKGMIEFVNPKFTKITGYSAEEAIGQNPRMLKSGLTPPETYQKVWSTIAAGKIWEGEFINKCKNGCIYYEHATISSLSDNNGDITHFMAIKEDITEKKSLFEQLAHSQKIESIGQLAGGLAHDLNNILSVVSGYVTLAQLGMDKEQEQFRYLDEVIRATSRAAALTHSLLAYSRKQEMNQQRQDLNLLITTVGSFISRIIRDNIIFTLSLAAEPLGVNVDMVQIEQVLLNLATNARDAMADGGTFTIATTAGSMDERFIATHSYGTVGRYAVITVTDSGHGMDQETKRKVFDPFFTTKESGKGTGLGLAMVMGIIKQHGGFIDLQSEPGRGSVFQLYLPLVEAEEVTVPPADQDTLIEKVSGTILVAEDDPETCALLAEFLTIAGYTVITATDGQDAVEKFAARKEEIELVISDVVMPRKSGKAASEEIRQMSDRVKFMFISGHANDVIWREGDLGADVEIIAKPILPYELLKNIKALMTNVPGPSANLSVDGSLD